MSSPQGFQEKAFWMVVLLLQRPKEVLGWSGSPLRWLRHRSHFGLLAGAVLLRLNELGRDQRRGYPGEILYGVYDSIAVLPHRWFRLWLIRGFQKTTWSSFSAGLGTFHRLSGHVTLGGTRPGGRSGGTTRPPAGLLRWLLHLKRAWFN